MIWVSMCPCQLKPCVQSPQNVSYSSFPVYSHPSKLLSVPLGKDLVNHYNLFLRQCCGIPSKIWPPLQSVCSGSENWLKFGNCGRDHDFLLPQSPALHCCSFLVNAKQHLTTAPLFCSTNHLHSPTGIKLLWQLWPSGSLHPSTTQTIVTLEALSF